MNWEKNCNIAGVVAIQKTEFGENFAVSDYKCSEFHCGLQQKNEEERVVSRWWFKDF